MQKRRNIKNKKLKKISKIPFELIDIENSKMGLQAVFCLLEY